MNDVSFNWHGKTYVVDHSAYNKRYIVLPNRTVIRVSAWTDNMPPQVCKVEHPFHHMSVGEVAEHMGHAILAREYV